MYKKKKIFSALFAVNIREIVAKVEKKLSFLDHRASSRANSKLWSFRLPFSVPERAQLVLPGTTGDAVLRVNDRCSTSLRFETRPVPFSHLWIKVRFYFFMVCFYYRPGGSKRSLRLSRYGYIAE